MGVCYELRLHERADYMKVSPILIINSDISGGGWGWIGDIAEPESDTLDVTDPTDLCLLLVVIRTSPSWNVGIVIYFYFLKGDDFEFAGLNFLYNKKNLELESLVDPEAPHKRLVEEVHDLNGPYKVGRYDSPRHPYTFPYADNEH